MCGHFVLATPGEILDQADIIRFSLTREGEVTIPGAGVAKSVDIRMEIMGCEIPDGRWSLWGLDDGASRVNSQFANAKPKASACNFKLNLKVVGALKSPGNNVLLQRSQYYSSEPAPLSCLSRLSFTRQLLARQLSSRCLLY